MSDFDIVPLNRLDPAMVQSWLATCEAVQDHDWLGLIGWSPVRRLTGLVQHGEDTERERYVAVADGKVLGWTELELPMRDNTHLVEFELEVHPEHRRRGIGTALIRHLEARAAELGRGTLDTWAGVPAEGGPQVNLAAVGFAEAVGYRNSLVTVMRRCDLDAVDEEAVEKLWVEACAASGEFELIEYVGEPPAEVIDGIAYLNARMYTDMPLGEWDLQEADFDADRVRDLERRRRERGELHLQIAVRHKSSGEVAGFTEIIIEGGREHECFQSDTIVDPRFRGHRLGLLLKIANQRRIRAWRPKMRYVWTGNAASNRHMIAINEAVGYRVVCDEHVYQKKIG